VVEDYEKKLADLAKLEANWDSYGGKTIDPRCIESARKGLQHCPEGMPKVRVVPCSDGGVQLEWSKDGRELEIEFSPDGSVTFLRTGLVTGPNHAYLLMLSLANG
jgi:hypothetical protein